MNLQEFQKLTIDEFKGLFNRGSLDETPQDHATRISNMRFGRGEIRTREGLNGSFSFTHPTVRMFLATPSTGVYSLITCDGQGTIYRWDSQTKTETVFYQQSGITDFAALNMFGRTYVLPIGPAGNTMRLQVWDGTNAVRDALGLPPAQTFTASDGASGNVDPGVHKIAVSFITNSYFTTRPGPEVSGNFQPVVYTAPGGKMIHLDGIPTGGPNVVGRQILVTQAGQETFYYLTTINDNTTTTADLDFFDTDLVLSADSLFDLRHYVDAGIGDYGGIFKYHSRMVVWGRIIPTANNTDLGPDMVLFSEPGEPEAFNKVHGFVQLPTEFDGNYVRGVAELRDTLYFTKGVGVLSTQDNLDNPNTWPVTRVDGGVGSGFYGTSTIVASQTSLSASEIITLADIGGLYIFNGVVQQPPITWKIDAIWKRITKTGIFNQVTVAHDPFEQMIYILVPLDGSTQANYLIVGDYNEGLDYESIRWTIYNFQFKPRAISMINMLDMMGEFNYHLRVASDGDSIYKLDKSVNLDLGATLPSYYQTFLASYGNVGIFRALNVRAEGPVTATFATPYVNGEVCAQDEQRRQSIGQICLLDTPGLEYTRQINFTSEKMAVKLLSDNPFRIQRLDIYGKVQFQTRPLLTTTCTQGGGGNINTSVQTFKSNLYTVLLQNPNQLQSFKANLYTVVYPTIALNSSKAEMFVVLSDSQATALRAAKTGLYVVLLDSNLVQQVNSFKATLYSVLIDTTNAVYGRKDVLYVTLKDSNLTIPTNQLRSAKTINFVTLKDSNTIIPVNQVRSAKAITYVVLYGP